MSGIEENREVSHFCLDEKRRHRCSSRLRQPRPPISAGLNPRPCPRLPSPATSVAVRRWPRRTTQHAIRYRRSRLCRRRKSPEVEVAVPPESRGVVVFVLLGRGCLRPVATAQFLSRQLDSRRSGGLPRHRLRLLGLAPVGIHIGINLRQEGGIDRDDDFGTRKCFRGQKLQRHLAV